MPRTGLAPGRPVDTVPDGRGAAPRRRRNQSAVLPWLLLAPAALVIFGMVGYPIGRTLWLSFREADLSYLVSGESRFVGLDNYIAVFTDSHLRSVLLTT
ncbi:MAG: sugar ABC transporter permease, partial [Acidimicrobiia bacterium]